MFKSLNKKTGYENDQCIGTLNGKEKEMRYKAKDIARELGVSPAAVSLVLNNKPGVGDEKRQEIIKK